MSFFLAVLLFSSFLFLFLTHLFKCCAVLSKTVTQIVIEFVTNVLNILYAKIYRKQYIKLHEMENSANIISSFYYVIPISVTYNLHAAYTRLKLLLYAEQKKKKQCIVENDRLCTNLLACKTIK